MGDAEPIYYFDCDESRVDHAELCPAWSSLEQMSAKPPEPTLPATAGTRHGGGIGNRRKVTCHHSTRHGWSIGNCRNVSWHDDASRECWCTPTAQQEGQGQAVPELPMVNIGLNIMLTQKKWNDLTKQPVDSVFTKEAATSIWGTDVLKRKCPTGTLSNKARSLGKTVPFPPLTPEKVQLLRGFFITRLIGQGVPEPQAMKRAKQIRRFLNEKCTDARRQESRRERSNE
ncbi:unnamed protein product [Ixodes hexagonus]